MKGHIYTIEELMLDDSFVSYCLSTGADVSSHWKTIIRDNPEQEEIFDEAKNLVLALHGGLSKPEVNRQIEAVRQQLQDRRKEDLTLQPAYTPSLSSAYVVTETGRIKRKLLKTAASYVTIACLVAVIAWWGFSRSGEQSITKQIIQVQAGSFQSASGERETVSLPDGSTVILNSNSSVSWSADFNKNKRQIHLTGDAFFKIAKNPAKPFTVFAENIVTTALGTEFYIHGKKGVDNSVEVDLLEGKVSVADTSKSNTADLILFPGESGTSINGSNLQKTVFDSLQLRSWISGRISFNETPALKAFKQLEAWYGVEIKVKKKGIKNRFINGDYQDESLQDVLKVICFSINSRYSLKGNIVTIE